MTVSETAVRPDTATEDSEKIAPRAASAVVVPEVFAAQGYEALPFGFGNLWGVNEDVYIYKPLRAWDQAQKIADEVSVLTGGSIFTFASAVLDIMRGAVAIPPAVKEDGSMETEAEVDALRMEVFQQRTAAAWVSFLAACPAFKPAEFARRMIETCAVRRVGVAEECAGEIFKLKGPGSVEQYYKGRRQQVVKIGLAAFWGSCGDFFVGR